MYISFIVRNHFVANVLVFQVLGKYLVSFVCCFTSDYPIVNLLLNVKMKELKNLVSCIHLIACMLVHRKFGNGYCISVG